jgi:hypothetical protein
VSFPWAEQFGQRAIGLMEHGQASGALAKVAVAISSGMCETVAILAGGFEPPATVDGASGGNLNPSREEEELWVAWASASPSAPARTG